MYVRKLCVIGGSAGVVLPPKIRNELNLKIGDELLITYTSDKESIVIKKAGDFGDGNIQEEANNTGK